jgi:hypothetical protein
MPKYKILRNCFCHNPGDIVDIPEAEAKAIGIGDYVEPVKVEEQSNDNTEKQNDESPADTNETPEAETADVKSEEPKGKTKGKSK